MHARSPGLMWCNLHLFQQHSRIMHHTETSLVGNEACNRVWDGRTGPNRGEVEVHLLLLQVASVLVAASTQGQVHVMNSLFSAGNQPAILRDGLADHIMARSYVLLHDCSASAAPSEQAALLELRKAYGASSCQLIQINSRKASEKLLDDIWTPSRPAMIVPSTPPKAKDASAGTDSATAAQADDGERRGLLLSNEDVERIQSYVRNMLVKQVVDPCIVALHLPRSSSHVQSTYRFLPSLGLSSQPTCSHFHPRQPHPRRHLDFHPQHSTPNFNPIPNNAMCAFARAQTPLSAIPCAMARSQKLQCRPMPSRS